MKGPRLFLSDPVTLASKGMPDEFFLLHYFMHSKSTVASDGGANERCTTPVPQSPSGSGGASVGSGGGNGGASSFLRGLLALGGDRESPSSSQFRMMVALLMRCVLVLAPPSAAASSCFSCARCAAASRSFFNSSASGARLTMGLRRFHGGQKDRSCGVSESERRSRL